ncbi:tRNA epoxyqueuosine(34) reductase QueG [Candidatus Villigracilis saccharophilus]|uniref:tRNA epoxyqueuosine(34) reductase QueG n=1 Tax=Candidatus Villigracilis saccharophilus TaxID=3140684 RepID=UPI0031356445|nr:tRNA epoxyqueuosine(34) reductase QueG [Anaerolineales bacterium]
MTAALKQAIKQKARQLGFILAGVTSFEPPAHYNIFEEWLDQNKHGTMNYLAEERSRIRRADPKQILPECKSILVLAMPYTKAEGRRQKAEFQIASYALGEDYHDVIPTRLKLIVEFIEEQLGHPIPNRYYTDTGPILERELAQRAGLGWIGKNSMLINPRAGSTFFLAEILLGIELEPDETLITDHCGTCTRCIQACPTQCILPNRTLDARRCISYLTIELKEEIPDELRALTQDWIFGCDVCQQVCPWIDSPKRATPAFEPKIPLPVLTSDLTLTSVEFNQRFKKSPLKRAKRRGYLRNLAVAVGNMGNKDDIPILEQAVKDDEPLVSAHAKWAKEKLDRGF